MLAQVTAKNVMKGLSPGVAAGGGLLGSGLPRVDLCCLALGNSGQLDRLNNNTAGMADCGVATAENFRVQHLTSGEISLSWADPDPHLLHRGCPLW